MKKDNHSFWDRFSFLYDRFMRRDKAAYETMYGLIRDALDSDMRVLELATGTGLIALRIADKVQSVEATDYSEKMIAEALKKEAPGNVRFSVQDACELRFEQGSFDAVIISNALHIMPDPALALKNIKRVLKPDGLLIAPTFMQENKGMIGHTLWFFMRVAGFKVYHKWTAEKYAAFLRGDGFRVRKMQTIPAMFPLAYAEAEINLT